MSVVVERNRIKIYDSNGNLIEEKEMKLEDLINYLINNIQINVQINPSTGQGQGQFKKK
jgi:hypothetical protein